MMNEDYYHGCREGREDERARVLRLIEGKKKEYGLDSNVGQVLETLLVWIKSGRDIH